MALNIIHDAERLGVLRIMVDRRWTWHDLSGLFEELAEMLEGMDGKTSVIIDFNHSSHMPVGFTASAPRIASMDPRLRGCADRLVFAGASGLQRVALEMLLRLMPADSSLYAIAASLPDAYALLERVPAGAAGDAA